MKSSSLPAARSEVRAPLLAPDEPPAFERVWHGPRHPALLVCDHASNRVPRSLARLGLSESALALHIAWDIGASEMARLLARRMELPLVLAGYSRLVVDCNRPLDDPTSIVTESDGHVVPGNRDLDRDARAARAQACFEPYHEAIDETLAELRGLAQAPALIALHSFTPRMRGDQRRWHCGVLWDQDPRIPLQLIAALREEPGLVVGDNEPYSGRDPADFTVGVHAEQHGWPHVCIEIRQDLLETPSGIEQWVDRLARALEPILEQRSLYHAVRLEPKRGGR